MSYVSSLQRRFTNDATAIINDEDGERCVKDMYQAAIEGDVECLAANIKLGADVNAMGQPRETWGPRFEKSGLFAASPLHYACSYGREEAVKLLLQHGARTDQRSASGHTPKEYARLRNYVDIIHMLDQHILGAAASGQYA